MATTDGASDYPHVVLEDVAYGSGEWRAKGRGVRGVGFLDEAGRVDLAVQHVVHPPEHLGEWPDDNRRSRIVFITRGVRSEELTASLEAFRGIVEAGPLLLEADAPV